MISRIHNKLGTAGLVVAIVALVAALTGAAFAAGGGLTGKEKKEVKKIAKKFAGKPGPQGPIGLQGPAGKDGTNGTNGTNGTDGKDGTNGKSVVLTTEAKGANCPEGGTKVEVEGSAASKKYVCNGSTGFTETLPSGETETGAWALGNMTGPSIVPLSFNIPLATAPTAIHYINEAGEERSGFPEAFHEAEHCFGSFDDPTAPPGEVCIYAEKEVLASGAAGYAPIASFTHLYKTGATFFYNLKAEEDRAWGTWAVTAG
jgi:hypothetical protein